MRRTYKAYLRGDCQNTASMFWTEENGVSNFNTKFFMNSLNSHTDCIHKNVDKQEEPNNNIKPLEPFFNTTHKSLENWLFESLQDINTDKSFDIKQILAKLDEHNAQKGNVKEITNIARSFSFSRVIETFDNKSAYELMVEDKNILDFIKRDIKITTEDYLKAINKHYSMD